MNINIVLVSSKYPRNVGMVARAMANFNIQRLLLVTPQCEINVEAREGAAQGQKPLREAVVYRSWQEFLENEQEGPRLAFSRRNGKKRQAQPLAEVVQWEGLQDNRPIYLIFGPEDHGLSGEDLELAHRVCYFELPGDLQSMNLSHAVVYTLAQLAPHLGPVTEPAPPEKIELPEDSLRQWLEALNFDLSQERWNALIALRQFLMKAAPTQKEIQLFNNVIQQTLRRLRE